MIGDFALLKYVHIGYIVLINKNGNIIYIYKYQEQDIYFSNVTVIQWNATGLRAKLYIVLKNGKWSQAKIRAKLMTKDSELRR